MKPELFSIIYWTLLYASFWGWGRFLREVLTIKTPIKTGLSAMWGMALTIFFANIVLLMNVGPPKFLWWTWIGGGAIFAIRRFRLEKTLLQGKWKTPRAVLTIFLISSIFARVWGSYHDFSYSCFDDLLAYLPQIKKILDSGTMTEPFSLRRMASYGGQQVLQSFFTLATPIHFTHFFDDSFMLICAVMLILGSDSVAAVTKRVSSIYLLAICLVFVWQDSPRINIAAEMSGFAFFLAIHLTIWGDRSYNFRQRLRESILCGILTGAFASLRATYAFGAGLLWLLLIIRSRRNRERTLELAAGAATALAFSIPAAALLHLSSGTPFFPIFKGNFHETASTTFIGSGKITDYISQIGQAFETSYGYALLILLFLNRVLNRKIKTEIITIAGIATLIAIILSLYGTGDTGSQYRYAYPFIMVPIIDFSFGAYRADVLKQINPAKSPIKTATAIFTVLYLFWFVINAGINVVDFTKMSRLRFEDSFSRIRNGLPDELQEYDQINLILPQDGITLAAVEHPYLLNFKNKKIWLLDIPGQVSPGAEVDWTKPLDQIEKSLWKIGVRYLLFESPDHASCQYSRANWEKVRNRASFHTPWKVIHMGLFKYLDWKVKTGSLVYSNGHYNLASVVPTASK